MSEQWGQYLSAGEIKLRKWSTEQDNVQSMDKVIDIRKKRLYMGDCSEHIGFGVQRHVFNAQRSMQTRF